jgi:hypothetical protein
MEKRNVRQILKNSDLEENGSSSTS